MINYNQPVTTVKKTVTESEYDSNGNVVKQTVTETVTTTSHNYTYQQPVVYGSSISASSMM